MRHNTAWPHVARKKGRPLAGAAFVLSAVSGVTR